jgi:hypothetical protein
LLSSSGFFYRAYEQLAASRVNQPSLYRLGQLQAIKMADFDAEADEDWADLPVQCQSHVLPRLRRQHCFYASSYSEMRRATLLLL